jgi:hypothetical protein
MSTALSAQHLYIELAHFLFLYGEIDLVTHTLLNFSNSPHRKGVSFRQGCVEGTISS